MNRLFLLVATLLLAGQAAYSRQYIANHDLKMRNSLAHHHATIGTIHKGDTVEGGASKDAWIMVTAGGKSGYVQSSGLRTIPDLAPAAPEEEVRKWPMDNIIIVSICALVGIVVLRGIFLVIRDRLAPESGHAHGAAAHVQKPTHWYHCIHCRVAVKKHTLPSDMGCVRGAMHAWVELAEVGANKYMCRNCSLVVKAKTEPVQRGCPEADYHSWKQI